MPSIAIPHGIAGVRLLIKKRWHWAPYLIHLHSQ